MLQILSKYWKGPTNVSPQKFAIWLHVEAGCPSSDDGALVQVAVMVVVVDTVIQVMVEGMVEGADWDFPHVTGTQVFWVLYMEFLLHASYVLVIG